MKAFINYLLSLLNTVFLDDCGISGFVILDADLLVGCGTLLIWNILIDLFALLVIDGSADVFRLCLVVCLVSSAALLGVYGGANVPVHVVIYSSALRAVRVRGVDNGGSG